MAVDDTARVILETPAPTFEPHNAVSPTVANASQRFIEQHHADLQAMAKVYLKLPTDLARIIDVIGEYKGTDKKYIIDEGEAETVIDKIEAIVKEIQG